MQPSAAAQRGLPHAVCWAAVAVAAAAGIAAAATGVGLLQRTARLEARVRALSTAAAHDRAAALRHGQSSASRPEPRQGAGSPPSPSSDSTTVSSKSSSGSSSSSSSTSNNNGGATRRSPSHSPGHSATYGAVLQDVANVSVVLVSYFHAPPPDPRVPNYVTSTFAWNALYCYRHPGHRFVFYIPPQVDGEGTEPPDKDLLPTNCNWGVGKPRISLCIGPNGCHLHPSWCKLKAMLNASASFPSAEWLLWLDSDAVVTRVHAHMPFPEWAAHFASKMAPLRGPLFANLATPGWFCDDRLKRPGVRMRRRDGNHYPHCFNAGVFLARSTDDGRKALQAWWHSALDDYRLAAMELAFREHWPWEQERLHALQTNETGGVASLVQVVPQAGAYRYPQDSEWRKSGLPCLSSLPEYQCFVSHYCYDSATKVRGGHIFRDLALKAMLACWRGPHPERCPVEPGAVDAHALLLFIVVNDTAQPHDWRQVVIDDAVRRMVPRHVVEIE